MSVVMRLRVLCPCVLLLASAVGAAAQGVSAFAHAPAWNGPPLGLADALRDALDRNPGLVAARAAVAPLAERPAQEGSLTPPRLDAQIWQWPLTTLNPANVDMYMFMLEQELPGRGKRARRVANAEKELALADADVNMRRLAVAADVRRAYVTLALARRDFWRHTKPAGRSSSSSTWRRPRTLAGAGRRCRSSKRCWRSRACSSG